MVIKEGVDFPPGVVVGAAIVEEVTPAALTYHEFSRSIRRCGGPDGPRELVVPTAITAPGQPPAPRFSGLEFRKDPPQHGSIWQIKRSNARIGLDLLQNVDGEIESGLATVVSPAPSIRVEHVAAAAERGLLLVTPRHA